MSGRDIAQTVEGVGAGRRIVQCGGCLCEVFFCSGCVAASVEGICKLIECDRSVFGVFRSLAQI